MKKIFSILTIAASLLTVASCSDDTAAPNNGGGEQTTAEGITFSVGADETRAHYNASDWRQIEWDLNDNVLIACNETQAPTTITDKTQTGYYDDSNWASKTSATYLVTKLIAEQYTITGTGGTATITANRKAEIAAKGTAKDALYWGKYDNGSPIDHTFYAAYGDNVKAIDASSGVATCEYQPEQTLFYDATRGEWINNKSIYMVAKTTTRPADNVSLAFSPIMTTVEIQVVGSTTTATKIKAVEITIPSAQDKLDVDITDHKVYFKYDIKNSAAQNVTTQTAEKFIFNLASPASLPANGSLKIIAVLPPVEISATNPITITVDASDRTLSRKFTPTTTIPAGYKTAIKMEAWDSSPAAAVEGIDYVDLGTGVKWATRNLGAITASEIGDYFGWGCNMPYATSIPHVDWTYYFQKLGGTGTAVADCGTSKDPLQDLVYPNANPIYNSAWDPASVRLGKGWRMPTQEELNALGANCDWTADTKDGVAGYTVTGKGAYSSKSIFIPIGGERGEWEMLVPNYAYYWSATPNTNNAFAASALFVPKQANRSLLDSHRWFGMLIRPVYDPSVPEAVDLGLSVMWATCNLGATSPEAYGDYYGWGCTEPYASTDNVDYPAYFIKLGKKNTTGWTEAKCGTNDDPLKDYVTNKNSISGTKWDAAHVKLGGKWRLPTTEEMQELVSKCDWEWTSQNGVNGHKIMLKSDHSVFIFLPLPGERYGTSLFPEYQSGQPWGHYWSGTPYSDDYKEAYLLYLLKDDTTHGVIYGKAWNIRPCGFSIRPVRDRDPIEAGGNPTGYGDNNQLMQ